MNRIAANIARALVVAGVWAGVSLSVGVAPASAERIKDILVVDNTKTKDETVLFIADIEKGDKWSPEMAARIEADLVNSGLFKDVEVFSQPVVGGVQVTIKAKDKHSWIIAPTVYNQPTNKGGGVGFGENNLFGENKKLLLYAQIATGDSFFIGAYVDPSINGTRFHWQYDVFLRRERVFEYQPPTDKITSDPLPVRLSKMNYLNSGITAGFSLFRKLKFSLRFRGAYVFYDDVSLVPGANEFDVAFDPANDTFVNFTGPVTLDNIPPPGKEGWDFSTEAMITYDGTANWYGITSGSRFKLALERSVSAISGFDYIYGSIKYTRARKYFSRHNLIIKASAGYGINLPFQQEWTSGGTDLRGFKNRQLRGNVRGALTTEYSVPVVTIKGWAFRVLGFFDSTYTAFRNTDDARAVRNYLPEHETDGFAPFKNTVGIGTRLYVRQIVLPLLGLDLGYGLERGQTEIYFAIGLTGF